MSVLILNRGPLSLRPYADWLADYPGPLLLLTSAEHLGPGEELPAVGGAYGYVEAIENYDDSGRVEARALELADRFDIRHVIACQEVDLQRAAVLREVLGLAGQHRASADGYRDKLRMKQLVSAAGLPVAPHAAVETAVDVLAFARDAGYPLVVKPRDGLSSVGLRILGDEQQLVEWLRTDFAASCAGAAGWLVEAFVPGGMYHVDGLIVDGQVRFAWPSQYMYQLAAFTPGGADGAAGKPPAAAPRLDATLDPGPLADRLVAFTRAVVDALPSPGTSTFHAEIFRTPDDQLVLCEIASRNGGALIKSVLKAVFGIDFPVAWVRLAVGLPVPELRDADPARPARMAGQVLLLRTAGVVRHVPAAPDDDWVERFEIFVRPGERLAAAKSSGDYMAAMVISGPTRQACEERMRRAAQWLAEELQVEPERAAPSFETIAR